MTNSETPNQATSKTLDTRISEITVYSDRARVTRRFAVELNGAERNSSILNLKLPINSNYQSSCNQTKSKDEIE